MLALSGSKQRCVDCERDNGWLYFLD